MVTGPLFPTSVVGSLPRPDYVKDLINDAVLVPPDEYRRLMGLAISSAVALQEMAGLDVVTDGEWWRKSYPGGISELAPRLPRGSPVQRRVWPDPAAPQPPCGPPPHPGVHRPGGGRHGGPGRAARGLR